MSWVVGWSIFILLIVDYNLSKMRNESIWEYIIPHIFVLFIVIYSTRYFGNLLKN